MEVLDLAPHLQDPHGIWPNPLPNLPRTQKEMALPTLEDIQMLVNGPFSDAVAAGFKMPDPQQAQRILSEFRKNDDEFRGTLSKDGEYSASAVEKYSGLDVVVALGPDGKIHRFLNIEPIQLAQTFNNSAPGDDAEVMPTNQTVKIHYAGRVVSSNLMYSSDGFVVIVDGTYTRPMAAAEFVDPCQDEGGTRVAPVDNGQHIPRPMNA